MRVFCLLLPTKSPVFAGVTVIGEVNQLTTHVMNVLWLLGTFTFAIVIGIIGEDVTNTIMVSFVVHILNSIQDSTTKISMSPGRTVWVPTMVNV